LPAIIWAGTFVMVVATDLLTGVLTGLALSLLELVPFVRKLKLRIEQQDEGDGHRISLAGTATCVSLPKASAVLEGVDRTRPVTIDMARLQGADHTFAEMLREWLERRRKAGGSVEFVGGSGKLRQQFGAA
jgi:MFS superfamily sulfate permease-like transporter